MLVCNVVFFRSRYEKQTLIMLHVIIFVWVYHRRVSCFQCV